MRFKHSSSTTPTMALMERKKTKQSSSCMAAFFNFFAKRKFFSSKKKFLPSVRTPKKSPAQKTKKINLLLDGRRDEVGTTSTEPSKTGQNIVAKLMGLETVTVKPQPVPIASESVQTNLYSVLDPPLAMKSVQEKLSQVQVMENASKSVQNKVLNLKLPLALKSVEEKSSLVTNATESVQNIVWKPLNNPALASKPVQGKKSRVRVPDPLNALESKQNRVSKQSNQNQNQQRIEHLGLDPCPTQPVKSPPRSLSPIENVKLLEATARLLEIGSQPIMTRFVNPEKFGSKLNDAVLDLDELKDNTSNNSSSNCNNSINNNNYVKSGKKTDVSPKRGISTGEIKRDLQKGPPNRRKSQENSPLKTPLKQNNLKQNKSGKDFIALNRSMLNNTALRKKYNGLERKTENKNPVKKANKPNNNNNSNINNNNANANMKKIEGVTEKRAGKELLIWKGAGQVSEKPTVFKNRAKNDKEEDMCIVSFTFSSPLKHKHVIRDFSRVYKEETIESSITRSSIYDSVSQDDGNHKSPVSILQANLLNNDSSSSSSTGISETDLEMKETSANKTEEKNVETKSTSANIISSSKIVTSKFWYSLETESKIQLLLQNILSVSPKNRQVSAFVNDATESILKTLFKTQNNSKEENHLVRNYVMNFIIEHLDLVQNRVLDFGYNSWRKLRAFYTKEKIVKEIEKEILKLQNLQGKELEILVEKDMENWEDLGVSFEIGVQIEKEIISQLIDEIVTDFAI